MKKGYILLTVLLIVSLLIMLSVVQMSYLTIMLKRVDQYQKDTQAYFQAASERSHQKWIIKQAK